MKAIRAMAVVLVVALCVPAVTVSVDKATRYQTIEGFGAGIHGFNTWKIKNGVFYVDANMDALGFYDSVVSQLGITEIRMLEDGLTSTAQGEFVVTGYMRQQMMHMRKFREAALRQREPLSFIASILSPPAYMKVSGKVEGIIEAAPNYSSTDCRLKDGYDDEYAGFLRRFLQEFRTSVGAELYGLSIQNEPAFQEPYASCVYNGPRYASVLKVVADTLGTSGLTTRLFGSENMAMFFPSGFETSVRADAVALAAIHSWAVHGYTDGVQADTGSFGGSSTTDKPLWMSETSGGAFGASLTDWNGAMTLARQIHGYLRGGRMSFWNFLHTMVVGDPAGAAGSGLYSDGQPTAKAYASAHFYRYIRPGARQVASTSSDNGVSAVAFWHEANQCLSIVLINTSSSAVSLTGVSGTGMPSSFESIQSTAATQNVRTTYSASGTLSLPGNSITTLVSGTYRNTEPVSVARPAGVAPAVKAFDTPSRTYTLAGKRIAGMSRFAASSVVVDASSSARRIRVAGVR